MMKTQNPLLHAALLINRLSLGLLFVLAGVRKLIPTEDEATTQRIKAFARSVADKAPLPEPLGLAYGYALPWAEIVFGAMLILGLFSRIAALAIALMLLSFLIAMGPAWWPQSGSAYDKNFILLSLAILLVVTGSGKYALRADGSFR